MLFQLIRLIYLMLLAAMEKRGKCFIINSVLKFIKKHHFHYANILWNEQKSTKVFYKYVEVVNTCKWHTHTHTIDNNRR